MYLLSATLQFVYIVSSNSQVFEILAFTDISRQTNACFEVSQVGDTNLNWCIWTENSLVHSHITWIHDRVPYIAVVYLLTVYCFTEMGKRSYCLGFWVGFYKRYWRSVAYYHCNVFFTSISDPVIAVPTPNIPNICTSLF